MRALTDALNPVGEVVDHRGSATVMRDATGKTVAAADGTRLYLNDRISTGDNTGITVNVNGQYTFSLEQNQTQLLGREFLDRLRPEREEEDGKENRETAPADDGLSLPSVIVSTDNEGHEVFTQLRTGEWVMPASGFPTSPLVIATTPDPEEPVFADDTPVFDTRVVIDQGNAPVIAGEDTGSVAEDGDPATLTIQGALIVRGEDAGESFIAEILAGAYGNLDIASDGSWAYSAVNGQAAIQGLAADDTLTDTFTITHADSVTTHTVTITIEGVDDVPVITGDDTGSVIEDEDPITLTDNGTLIASGGDAGEDRFNAETLNGAYGDLAVAADGSWAYSADNTQAPIQSLALGDTLTDAFTVTNADGVTMQTVTITVHGVNDPAVVSSDAVSLTETDAAQSTNGTLNSTDIDNADNSFTAGATTGTLGDFAIDGAGAWTFSANSAFDSLNVGDSVTETFNVTSIDGTPGAVTVTINGVNDPAVVSSDVVALTETDAILSVGGTLTSADIDNADNSFTASSTSGTVGDFAIAANGAWTFSANSAFDSLNVGDNVTETFNVTSVDGTSSTVTITINGEDDAPVITGDTVGSVTEDDDPITLTNGGVLTASGGDAGEDRFNAETLNGAYGDLAVAADGSWVYSADNTQAVIQNLALGDTLTDAFTVTNADSVTMQTVTITIHGVNDPAVVSSDAVALMETDAVLSTGGTLISTDIDNADNRFTVSFTIGTIGDFAINANGAWIFSANSAFDSLNTGGSVTETFNVTSIDGTPGTVTVTINGTNDEATVGSDAVSLTETDAALSTGGTLASTDIDNADNSFTAGATTGTLGDFAIDGAGAWTFSANSAFDSLNVGDSVTETFNVTSIDGTPGAVTVTINGVNDPAVVSSDAVTLTETDAALNTSGTLTSVDIDNADNSFAASATTGTLGDFAIDGAGAWTFSANSAFDSLNTGGSVTETFNVTSIDGTPGTVTVTINGTNDEATVGSDAVSLTETDAALSTGGTLASTDIDNADNSFTAGATTGTLGDFAIDGAGAWTFSANSAFDSLNVGDSVTETFNVTSIDGTPGAVTVTIQRR